MPRSRLRLRSSSSSLFGSTVAEATTKRHINIQSSSSNDNTALKEDQKHSEIIKRIDDLEHVLKNCFNRLTEEVVTLRREVNRQKKHVEEQQIEKLLPAAAFATPEILLEFEEKIRDAQAFNRLVGDLMCITGSTAADYVRNCWHNIIKDEVSQFYSWFGSKTKKPAKDLIVAAAIKGAFQRKYPSEALELMEDRSKKYFHYAKDRLTKKIKYQNKN